MHNGAQLYPFRLSPVGDDDDNTSANPRAHTSSDSVSWRLCEECSRMLNHVGEVSSANLTSRVNRTFC